MSDWWYGLCRGVRNLRRWWPIIWRDEDFDWEYLTRIMEQKLRWMADHHEEERRHVGLERSVRQMRTCAALLRRMSDDEYFRNAGYDRDKWMTATEGRKRWMAHHSKYMKEQDKKYLGKILGKYLDHWWN